MAHKEDGKQLTSELSPADFLSLLDDSALPQSVQRLLRTEDHVISSLVSQGAMMYAALLQALHQLLLQENASPTERLIPSFSSRGDSLTRVSSSRRKLSHRLRVGIYGAGRVGLNLAVKLLALGLVKPEHLVIKARASDRTLRKLEEKLLKKGLTVPIRCVEENCADATAPTASGEQNQGRGDILRDAARDFVVITESAAVAMAGVDVLFLCVRPSQLLDFREELLEDKAQLPPLVYSYLSATPLQRLSQVFSGLGHCQVLRCHFNPEEIIKSDQQSEPEHALPSETAESFRSGFLDLTATRPLAVSSSTELFQAWKTFPLLGWSHAREDPRQASAAAPSIFSSTVEPLVQVILDCLVEGVGKEETERAVGTAFFGEERSKMLDVVKQNEKGLKPSDLHSQVLCVLFNEIESEIARYE